MCRTSLILLSAASVLSSATTSEAQCETNNPNFSQMVRFQVPGTNEFHNIAVPLWLVSPHPGNPNGYDWGSFWDYGTNEGNPGQATCNSGRNNCRGLDYSWQDIDIDISWMYPAIVQDAAGAQHQINLTQAHGVAYWDWVYPATDGYSRAGNSLDYTQNCHGYAIGVGGWPQSSIYGAKIAIDEGFCHDIQFAVEINTKFATMGSYGHSIALTVQEWEDEYTSGVEIVQTKEKWSESPIYQRTVSGVELPSNAPGGTAGQTWALYAPHESSP